MVQWNTGKQRLTRILVLCTRYLKVSLHEGKPSPQELLQLLVPVPALVPAQFFTLPAPLHLSSRESEGLGLCYPPPQPPQPPASADNTNLGLDHSRYHAKT